MIKASAYYVWTPSYLWLRVHERWWGGQFATFRRGSQVSTVKATSPGWLGTEFGWVLVKIFFSHPCEQMLDVSAFGYSGRGLYALWAAIIFLNLKKEPHMKTKTQGYCYLGSSTESKNPKSTRVRSFSTHSRKRSYSKGLWDVYFSISNI